MASSLTPAVSRLFGRLAGRPSTGLTSCVRNIRSSNAMRRAKIELDQVDARTDMRQWIKPNNFQKMILIIGKAFKKPSDIPEAISPQTMRKAFDIFRGRTMVAMVILAFIGAHFSIQSGRKLSEKGDSLNLRGIIQEEKWREEGRREREAREKQEAGDAK